MERSAAGWIGLGALLAAACGNSGSGGAPVRASAAGNEAVSGNAGEGPHGGSGGTGGTSAGQTPLGAGDGGDTAGPSESGGTAGGGAPGNSGGSETGGGAAAGRSGATGEGGQLPVLDTTPPGPVSLPQDGSYNIATAFDCAVVNDIEAGASVYYELKSDGTPPAEPTVQASAKLDASHRVCSINHNGTTTIAIRQVDEAGNLGPVTRHQYAFDTKAPVICGASASPSGRAYSDLPLHLRLTAEPLGSASIEIGAVGTATLRDDGTAGDSLAGDGVYELDYQIPAGADVPNAVVTARFSDAAANSAQDFPVGKLNVDRTATMISGAMVSDAAWTAAASPYVITADTAFADSTSLTLEPGVVVIFKNAATLKLLGDFQAVGTVDKPIVMYRASLAFYGTMDALTYAPSNSSYVTGPHLEFVDMHDGRLMLGNRVFSAAGAYIRHCAIGTITGEDNNHVSHGMFIDHSWIGRIANFTWLRQGRLSNSYFDSIVMDGFASENLELTYSQIGVLETDRWWSTSVLAHSNLGQLRLHRPTQAGSMSFHDNNLGSALAATTLLLLDGTAADLLVDASANYWGALTTTQMTSLGNQANISAIHDFYDDVNLPRVEYQNWLTSPATAGPNWARSELLPEAAAEPQCESSGGSGGSGGAASGSGGSGAGAGGSGGSGAGSLIGACQNGSGYYCVEYNGPAQNAGALQSSCQLTSQLWQGTCSSSQVIGTCAAPYPSLNGVSTVTRYYPGSPATPEQLQEACQVGAAGTWTTP